MNLWCILLLYPLVNNGLVYASRLSNYISDYQLVELKIIYNTESGSLANARADSHGASSWPSSIRLRFSAFDKEFDFTVTKDEDHEPVTLQNIDYVNSTIRNWKPKFYEKLSDDRQPIAAFGYFQDDAFVGYITLRDVTYFLEPSSWYFPELDKNATVLIYESMGLVSPLNPVVDAGNFTLREDKFIPRQTSTNYSRNTLSNEELICKIEIVGDKTLFEFENIGIERIAMFLYYHVKFSDKIFRTTNFGLPPIRISPKYITINSPPIEKGTVDPDTPMTSKQFLYKFSQQPHPAVCLSFSICNKNFTDERTGASFRAYENSAFGMCQTETVSVENNLIHVNVGIMTIRSRDNKRVPLSISTKAFTHELGHLFGSDHDPPNSSICSSDNDYEYYLMNKEAPNNLNITAALFSPCSITNMSLLIQERIGCLNTTHMFCGNGIREGTEECDCGAHQQNCQTIDKCCNPPDKNVTGSGCTFRRFAGSVCSPLENVCCDDNCQFAKQTLCYYDDEHCLFSYCNGASRECPDPSPSEDGTPCKLNSGTCINGTCNTTICVDKRLSDCICEEESFSCQICCKRPDTTECVPAWMLGFYAPNRTKYIRKPNSLCESIQSTSIYGQSWNSESRCDESGRCIPTNRSKSHETKFNWIILFALIGAIVITLTFISVIIFILHLNR